MYHRRALFSSAGPAREGAFEFVVIMLLSYRGSIKSTRSEYPWEDFLELVPFRASEVFPTLKGSLSHMKKQRKTDVRAVLHLPCGR